MKAVENTSKCAADKQQRDTSEESPEVFHSNGCNVVALLDIKENAISFSLQPGEWSVLYPTTRLSTSQSTAGSISHLSSDAIPSQSLLDAQTRVEPPCPSEPPHDLPQQSQVAISNTSHPAGYTRAILRRLLSKHHG
jgi:hypothetical protein